MKRWFHFELTHISDCSWPASLVVNLSGWRLIPQTSNYTVWYQIRGSLPNLTAEGKWLARMTCSKCYTLQASCTIVAKCSLAPSKDCIHIEREMLDTNKRRAPIMQFTQQLSSRMNAKIFSEQSRSDALEYYSHKRLKQKSSQYLTIKKRWQIHNGPHT